MLKCTSASLPPDILLRITISLPAGASVDLDIVHRRTHDRQPSPAVAPAWTAPLSFVLNDDDDLSVVDGGLKLEEAGAGEYACSIAFVHDSLTASVISASS